MPKLDDGHLGHAQLASGKESRMAGEYVVVGAHQDRIGPPPLPNRLGDLGHLLRRVRARVGNPGNQPSNRPFFYFDVDFYVHNSTHISFASVVRRRPVMPDWPRML